MSTTTIPDMAGITQLLDLDTADTPQGVRSVQVPAQQVQLNASVLDLHVKIIKYKELAASISKSYDAKQEKWLLAAAQQAEMQLAATRAENERLAAENSQLREELAQRDAKQANFDIMFERVYRDNAATKQAFARFKFDAEQKERSPRHNPTMLDVSDMTLAKPESSPVTPQSPPKPIARLRESPKATGLKAKQSAANRVGDLTRYSDETELTGVNTTAIVSLRNQLHEERNKRVQVRATRFSQVQLRQPPSFATVVHNEPDANASITSLMVPELSSTSLMTPEVSKTSLMVPEASTQMNQLSNDDVFDSPSRHSSIECPITPRPLSKVPDTWATPPQRICPVPTGIRAGMLFTAAPSISEYDEFPLMNNTESGLEEANLPRVATAIDLSKLASAKPKDATNSPHDSFQDDRDFSPDEDLIAEANGFGARDYSPNEMDDECRLISPDEHEIAQANIDATCSSIMSLDEDEFMDNLTSDDLTSDVLIAIKQEVLASHAASVERLNNANYAKATAHAEFDGDWSQERVTYDLEAEQARAEVKRLYNRVRALKHAVTKTTRPEPLQKGVVPPQEPQKVVAPAPQAVAPPQDVSFESST